MFPSTSVIIICKVAERVLKQHNLFRDKNVMNRLIHSAKQLIPNDVFSNLDNFLETCVIDIHKSQLVTNILSQYFNLRLHHEAKSIQTSIKRIRTFHNRLVIFSNQ